MYFCVYVIRSLKVQRAAQKRKIICSSVKMNKYPNKRALHFVMPSRSPREKSKEHLLKNLDVQKKLQLKYLTLTRMASVPLQTTSAGGLGIGSSKWLRKYVWRWRWLTGTLSKQFFFRTTNTLALLGTLESWPEEEFHRKSALEHK